MDSIEKFDENRLPDKEHFYSSLNGEHILDKHYQHAQKVWKMKDYHDHYLKSDVLLLADI